MDLISEENNVNNQFFSNDNDAFLLELFSKLYQSFNQDEVIIPSNQKYLTQVKKKLHSNFKLTKKDEPAIVNLLQDKVSKLSNFNPDIILHFQNLYHKLLHRRTLTKRWEILYLLNNLSKTPKLYKKLDYPENNILLNKLTNINCIISGDNIIDNENKFLNCKTKHKSITDIEEINPAKQQPDNEHPIIIDTNKSNLNLNITEKDIVTDLLYVLVGINGKYIKYDSNKDSYILVDNIPWEENIYDVVYSISEIGWLYYKINKYISFYKNSNIKSLYIQSLIFGIQNELDEYYKLISLFKKINNNDLSGNINHIPLNNSTEEIVKYQKKLNLKNLFMGVITYKEKLKWLLTSCESVYTLKGSSILSQIYSYVHYLGNQKCLNNVLNELSKSFIYFILNWIKYGEVQDPYGEFFVRVVDEVKDEEIWKEKYKLIWRNIPNFMKRDPVLKIFEIGKCIHFIRNYCHENYNLSDLKKVIQYIIRKYSDKDKDKNKSTEKENNINNNIIINEEEISTNNEDNSINEEMNNIFSFSSTKSIGEFDYCIDKDKIKFEIDSYKSFLNFINFIFSISSSNKEDKEKQKKLNISFLDEITKNIDVAHKFINKELIRIFFQKFKLMENLDSLNKYLLLGQGDMIQALMESLYEELKKPGNTIYKYFLQSILESSINATNARYNDKECLNKLNIKLLNPRPGDTGWDIFCLEYNISLPLSVIISKKNLLDYQKMFIFLLKIKRIEYSQEHQEWRKIMTNSHNIPSEKYDFFLKKIRPSLLLNQQIIHFIISLHNYLTLEVLETQYKKLLKKFKTLNNLDELISAHDEFIFNIKNKCFLDNKNNDNLIIYKKIIAIFEIILRFRTAHDVLVGTLLQKINEDDEEKSLREDDDDNEENEDFINYNKRIEESNKQILFLKEEFINKIIELINSMKEIGKDLEYLSMKLDFNYYYSFIEKEKEEKKQQLIIENLIEQEKKIRYQKQKEKENLYKHNNYNEFDEGNNNNEINEQDNNNDDNIENYSDNNNYNENMIYNNNNNLNFDYNYNNFENEKNEDLNGNNNINDNYENYNYNNINNDYNGNENNSYNYGSDNNINNNIIDDDNNNLNNYYNKYNNYEDEDNDKKYSGDEGMEEDEKNDKDY